MEIADFLIWAGLGFIMVRYILPRILDWMGITVEKKSKDQD